MSIWLNQFKSPIDYLTLESAITDVLLAENGDLIVLEQTGQGVSAWSTPTKN
jgi:hypothetical protein